MTSLSELGEASLGVWMRSDAIPILGRGRVDRLVAQGTWHSPWPGVLADGGTDLDPRQRAVAAVLASGGTVDVDQEQDDQEYDDASPLPAGAAGGRRPGRAVVCLRTAARVHRLPLIDDDDPATGADEHRLDHVHVPSHLRDLVVTAPPGTGRLVGNRFVPAPPRVLHRHQLALCADEVERTAWGLWVTTRARTLYDCAGVLTHEALVCAIDAALHRRLVTSSALVAMAERHHGEQGAPAFRAALEVADGRAESVAETLARLVLQPVLPGLEPQVKIYDDRGDILARVDLGDRAAKLAVETDGKRAHAGERMVAKDNRRDRGTRGQGWWTERATWWDCRRGQAALRQRVVGEHRRLMARPARP